MAQVVVDSEPGAALLDTPMSPGGEGEDFSPVDQDSVGAADINLSSGLTATLEPPVELDLGFEEEVEGEVSDTETAQESFLADYQETGEEEYFTAFYDRYKKPLFYFVRTFVNNEHDANEVVQNTFMQVVTSLHTFDPSRPERPWLFTIAANKAKDSLRRKQRKSREISEQSINVPGGEWKPLEDLVADPSEPWHPLIGDDRNREVAEVVVSLPEQLREILVLAYYNNFSYKLIAGILNIPIGTVKSRLHTAVGRFGKEFKSTHESANDLIEP